MTPERPGIPTGSALLLVLVLLIAAGLQSVVAGPLSGLTVGQPDFILVLVLVAALFTDSGVGCLVGFGGGLLTASLVGETVGSYLVSRVLAGFVAGRLSGRFFQGNLIVILAAVFIGSVVAEVAYGLAAPPLRGVSLLRYLQTAGGNILWNTALALPAAWVLTRCGWNPNAR
jgi:rod shape-determining protein MreD